MLWSLAQAISWYTQNTYPKWMFDIQGIISRRVLYRQRVTGLALEPSWLAHQLNMLYLPFWLSSVVNKYSSHRFRIFRISFETVLLIGGMGSLVLTLSRVGYAAFILMFIPVLASVHRHLVEMIKKRVSKASREIRPRIFQSGNWHSILLIIGYLSLLIGGLVIYSQIDPRMADLFNFSREQNNPLLRYFNDLKFGDRVIYWLTGWNIFNDYPLIGVGLGNAGFFFPDNILPYGWSLIEVRRLINRASILLNIKSIWFRLLAETGIIGFALFLGWLISILPTILEKIKSQVKIESVLGLTGLFVMLALVFEGFSIDSFAMPYWWISLGLAASLQET